ncbi:MAG: (Fe-S)-binding protein [Saprospiraceae bacterium]|nr:(Fe-S)-binding protein [Saprospiraceae bacterium]
MGIQQILFILVLLGGFGIALRQYMKIRRNILLGKEEKIEGQTSKRWKNVLLIAFGQKKMFKNWIPAIFHLFIYVAFLFTQVELIEIIIDGVGGVHRFFAPILGGFYTFLVGSIEVLSFLALIATIIFLWRRNALKIPRFVKSEMNGWPRLDANLILIGEIILVTGIFMMNGADTVLQEIDPQHYPDTGRLPVSGFLGPALFGGMSESSLVVVERTGWWIHFLTVIGFLNYLPFSKHLHLLLAFPNTYYAKLNSRGEMENMPEIMNEVKSMMGLTEEAEMPPEDAELPEFGAKDIFDLSWKNILDAYTCTECGRCTAECPANLTGKKLSPRKILMDIRDRVDEVGKKLDSKDAQYISEDKKEAGVLNASTFDDGRSLFDYISKEEIRACTTCNACVEACPVMINPLDPILKLRRYEVLTESTGPQDWIPMFTSLENSGSVWQVAEDRESWMREAINK